ncbi:MAG TPA: hypothetical protein VF717_14025 [Pyrinomonadaceae bacterium]|jgi:hypothetical protein
MKMLKNGRGSKAIVPCLFALALLLQSAAAIQVAAQTSKNDSHTTWQWVDNDWKKSLEIRGRAEFTEDYTDIKSVSEDGSVRIEETRGGTTRRLDVVPAAGGQLRRTFSVGGEPRPMNEQDRAWVAGMILEAVRRGGIDADKRVQRIFERRGVSGVLEEISLVGGDYARRIYFEALIKNRNLDASSLQAVFREAARQISSDYEQAQLLIGASELIAGRSQALPAFFEATGTIKSDYEHRRVLSTLLKKSEPVSRELLVMTVRSAARMASDYEKATLLKEVAVRNLEDAQLAAAFFQTADTIKSDYEHRNVLSALLKRRGLGHEVLGRLLESAARISSDYEKATLLLEASSAYSGDARLRGQFLRTVETIKSDYERGRVLSAMLKNKQMD